MTLYPRQRFIDVENALRAQVRGHRTEAREEPLAIDLTLDQLAVIHQALGVATIAAMTAEAGYLMQAYRRPRADGDGPAPDD